MRRQAPLALALLAAGFGLTLWLDPWADERVNDLFVYRSFAEPLLDGALPYRDQPLEYPPLAAPVIALPALLGGGEEGFRLAFAVWMLVVGGALLLLTGALAARTGGDRRRALFALALTPLLCGALVRTHFDVAPAALLVAALLLLAGDRPRAGLAVLGLGVLTKGFPLVALPIALAWLLGRGERRAAVQGTIALALVLLAGAAAALLLSPAGAFEAVRYQLERPLQVESTPALAVAGLDALGLGEAASVKSHRSDGLEHPAARAVEALALAALAAVLALLVLLAARTPGSRGLALAALGAVTAYALLGKVLSPQFLIWVLPLGALALAWRERALAGAVAVAALLTFAEFPSRYFEVVAREPGALALVGARNLALAAVLVLAIASLRRQQDLLDGGRPPRLGLDQDGVEPGVLVRGLEADGQHAAKAL